MSNPNTGELSNRTKLALTEAGLTRSQVANLIMAHCPDFRPADSFNISSGWIKARSYRGESLGKIYEFPVEAAREYPDD